MISLKLLIKSLSTYLFLWFRDRNQNTENILEFYTSGMLHQALTFFTSERQHLEKSSHSRVFKNWWVVQSHLVRQAGTNSCIFIRTHVTMSSNLRLYVFYPKGNIFLFQIHIFYFINIHCFLLDARQHVSYGKARHTW